MQTDQTVECRTLTVAKAAKMLGIGRDAAYDAIRSGELQSLRFGRRIVIPRIVVERMLGEAA